MRLVGATSFEVRPGPETVKALTLVAKPSAVVTVILPVEAPIGTVHVIELAETKELVAIVPLNLTTPPVKFVPLIVTVVPTAPMVGVNDVIVGFNVIPPVHRLYQPVPLYISRQVVVVLKITIPAKGFAIRSR